MHTKRGDQAKGRRGDLEKRSEPLLSVAVTFDFRSTDLELPDDDETLLLAFSDGEFEKGYHSDGHWHLEDTATLPPDEAPVAWARIPESPFTLEPQTTTRS